MVRLKGLVEATRVLVVGVMGKVPEAEENWTEESDFETETDDVDLDGEITVVEGGNDMDVARVYAGTVVELGLLLPGDTAFDTQPGS